jgi:Holliday junction resolvasome RuvABC DNA-binding subunit
VLLWHRSQQLSDSIHKREQDSIDAMVALGFKRKQAVARVDAVTSGSTAEEIIKSALQGGHRLSK